MRPYQKEAVAAVHREWDSGVRSTLLVQATGCHEPSQQILMADGSIRRADEICVGELLMGPDGKPREVLALHSGDAGMVRVSPVKGTPFVVTGDHVLACELTPKRNGMDVERIFLTPSEWLERSDTFRHRCKLYRSRAIERFDGNDGSRVTIDPYFLGILLGDGSIINSINVTTMDDEVVDEIYLQARRYDLGIRRLPAGKAVTYCLTCMNSREGENALLNELRGLGLWGLKSGEKHVPQYYKTLPLGMRMELVAGMLDADGCVSDGCYDYVSKSEELARDLAFMCRSVGLAAYVTETTKSIRDRGFTGRYWRVSISGDCLSIPCRVERRKVPARRQKKSVLRTGIASMERVGTGRYNGFTVSGDNLYLMGDFTVTHNCGKTITMAQLARDVVDDGGRVLLLAHRGELLNQAADKFERAAGLTTAREQASYHTAGTLFPVTVGSVQTMMRQSRLDEFGTDCFTHVFVDEAHHAVADSYTRILDYFDGARVLGVTATADRADKKGLSRVFESIALEYGLRQAVNDGYLCRIAAQTIPLDIDISTVKVHNGDFDATQLGHVLEPYLDAIADEMRTYCNGRKTVVFLPLVQMAKDFADLLNSKGMRACEIDGNTPNRAELFAAYERGDYDILTNSMLATEGWDCPPVDCIVCLRPTKSRGLFTQMVGRATRLFPGKENALILDFLWMTERHNLCRPASLLGVGEEVEGKATGIMSSGGLHDLFDLEDEAKRDVLRDRESSLADQLEQMRHRKKKLVDPLQYAMSIGDLGIADYEPTLPREAMEATQRQVQFLESRGIDTDSMPLSRGLASKLICALIERHDMGLATPKQIRFLERRGFLHCGEWRFDEASGMISAISSNGWKVPRGIRPSTYVPASMR